LVVGVGNGEDVPDDGPAETPDGGFEVVEKDGVVVFVGSIRTAVVVAFGPDEHFAVLRAGSDLLDVGPPLFGAIGRLSPNPSDLEVLS